MSRGIHGDTAVIMANGLSTKLRNLVNCQGQFTLTHDIRSLQLVAGYVLNCWDNVRFNSYFKLILEDQSRYLVTEGQRFLTSSNKLVPVEQLKAGQFLKLSLPTEIAARYDDRKLKEFSRESFIDANRTDADLLNYEDVSQSGGKVKILSVEPQHSKVPVQFFDLRIPQFHNYALRANSGVIFSHS